MKTKLNFLGKLIILSIMFASTAFSQNITNTLGSNGLFTVRGPSPLFNNFLTIADTSGIVKVFKNLDFDNTTNPSLGVITKGNRRFMHNFGTGNVFLGNLSGNFTMTGEFNSALGDQALLDNTSGRINVAVGSNSLFSNRTGSNNTAVGSSSLVNNVSGSLNTAVGQGSLSSNGGNGNTALGNVSLRSNIDGNNNTALGRLAGDNILGSNNIAIGFNALVPDELASNQVRIGDTLITYAGIQVAWDITSDRRAKSNILNSNLGLNFISKLRPVSYTRNNDENQKTEYGFIAQEIEDILKESGVDNSGIINIDDKGMYSMRYNDLLAPMVKAMQELKAENDELKKEVEQLKTVNEKIVKLEQIVNELTSVKHTSLTGKKVNLTNSK